MKHMRKILALTLVLLLVLSLATTAFAADSTITVKNAIENETYSIYKLFDLVVNDESNPTAYSYTVNSDWTDFFTGEGAKYVTINDAGYVTEIKDANGTVTETDSKDLAKAAAEWASKPTATHTKVASGETVEFTGLSNGYWLITSSLGTLAMIETTPAKDAVEVNEKNPENTIIKEVKEDSKDAFGASNDAQIGDTIEFKSTATVEPYTRNVVIHDKMDSGLTYTTGSVAIAGLTKGSEYTVNESPADGDTFDISFADSYINGLTETTTLTITYTATLNANAVVKDNNGVAIVDQENKTTINYGDKQSVESKTTTTTHKSVVDKYGDNVPNLADAEFSLKKGGEVVKLIKLDDQNYRVATADEIADEEIVTVNTFITVDDGDIVIWGLDTDEDYTLEEIAAPAGYNKLKGEVKLEVNADNNSVNKVLNQTGTELPSTGGIGTTIFYIVGGLLVAAAVILLVTKKRMASAE